MKYLLVLVLAAASFVLFPERAQAATCEASYTAVNSPLTTGWLRLADVSPVFPPSPNACRDQAVARCQVTRAALNSYAPAGSPAFDTICRNGGVDVSIDVKLDGVPYPKVAACKAPVTCKQRPCPSWESYTTP